jgi:hypothetical protein
LNPFSLSLSLLLSFSLSLSPSPSLLFSFARSPLAWLSPTQADAQADEISIIALLKKGNDTFQARNRRTFSYDDSSY